MDQNAINGSIVIDNIDISRVSLTCLRSRLCVIPQRPILFVGTLRYNLDPLDEYSDEECLAALESVQLKHLVVDNPDGLHLYVAECGANFSTGQCQLICIARAILKKSKILLIDEATANIDHATDSLIQTVIAENFHDRTILTVAHRLHTIAESNRILVLDQGAVADFDVPQNILPNSNNRTDLRTRL